MAKSDPAQNSTSNLLYSHQVFSTQRGQVASHCRKGKSCWLGSHSPRRASLSAGIPASAPDMFGQWSGWHVRSGVQGEPEGLTPGRCKALLSFTSARYLRWRKQKEEKFMKPQSQKSPQKGSALAASKKTFREVIKSSIQAGSSSFPPV